MNALAPGLEGAPVPCRRCGASVQVLPDLGLICRFCGLPDRLPLDTLGRVLEIRGRLAMAASRVAQVAATEAALASLFERRGAFWAVMGPWPVLAALVTANAVFGLVSNLGSMPASVPYEVRVELVVASLYGPFFVIGVALSFPMALFVGRWTYRRRVRPVLAARPPTFGGAPMRCRACGGDLPPTRDAFTTCRFCSTANAIATGHAPDVARALDQEIAGYRARAAGTLAGTTIAATHMTRTVFVCFALTYAGVFVLGALARLVLL